jgi:hypothetical protein
MNRPIIVPMGLGLLYDPGCDIPVVLSQVSGIRRQKNNDPDLQPIGVQSLFSCHIQVNNKPRPEDKRKSLF